MEKKKTRLERLDKIVSDWFKHREVSSLKHLGERAVRNCHSAIQTVYEGKSPVVPGVGVIQLSHSDPVKLALKNTSTLLRHSGSSGRPFPQHDTLFH